MDTYEIFSGEPGWEGAVLGKIEHTTGSGGAVLALNGCTVPVPYYANLADALQAVREVYGHGTAYLQKIKAA